MIYTKFYELGDFDMREILRYAGSKEVGAVTELARSCIAEAVPMCRGSVCWCEVDVGISCGEVDVSFAKTDSRALAKDLGGCRRAVIFGAGHIARALVPLLRSVEFRPVVYDDRPALADPAAFPDAERVVCGDFRNIASTLPLSPEDYVVVMTSGHLHDLEIQEQILRQELAYVGVIGSRAKIAAVNVRLREAGISEEKLRTVHTPVGTPIKAVTPAEIVVSITGEMIYERACRREDPTHHACPMV